MKRIFYILSYISLALAFNNIVIPNNFLPKSRISLKMQNNNMDAKNFDKIDKDKSGKLDQKELNNYYGNNEIMKLGDLNNDNEIDFSEFERVVNIDKFGIENGGNLYVRNAIKFGFLSKNSILADGTASIFVGNKGFDPLNCAADITALKKYREAEIKHGRLAMLATVGWPISELFHPYLSEITQNTNILSVNNKVPSILNGGLDKINPIFFMSIIVFTSTIESISLNKDYNNYFDDRIPGDYGFDPLNFYSNKGEFTKRDLELKELNNGRLAMLAITYFAFNEFITNNPIVTNSPLFFKSFL
tara:strand:- start:34284 stop:35192 length:909 start_codon:yes stop_codon:yes gene_type:complete